MQHQPETDRLSTCGELVDKPLLISQIKKRISELCHTRSPDQFPGGQPVSFQKNHIDFLLREDYYVCEKSDGIRYLLYSIGNGACFLINRKYEIRFVSGLCLPSTAGGFHNETLLDGELMQDSLGNGEFQLKFSIFDLLLLEGHSVMHLHLNDRLNCVFKQVMNPYRQHRIPSPLNPPFTLELKQMHKSYGVQEVLTQVIPALKHENDGLIFTPVNCPYRIGTWDTLLKWKPAHLNSVDFVLSCKQCNGTAFWVLLVRDRRSMVFWDYISHTGPQDDWWIERDGAVLECVWDPARLTMVNLEPDEGEAVPNSQRMGGWRPLRERTDKTSANERSVVMSILRSIEESVSEEELVERVGEIRKRYCARQARRVD